MMDAKPMNTPSETGKKLKKPTDLGPFKMADTVAQKHISFNANCSATLTFPASKTDPIVYLAGRVVIPNMRRYDASASPQILSHYVPITTSSLSSLGLTIHQNVRCI